MKIAGSVFGVGVLVFVAFGRSLWQGFAPIDDSLLVTGNLAIHGLTWENIRYVFTHFDPELYMPLTFLSYQIDHAIWGMNPFGFHLTNLLLHTLNSLLVAWLVGLLVCTRVMVSPSNHDTQLILAGGRGWHDDDIVKKACETPGVRWLGHVSGEKYRELLESATIFALPSLYEGFGLPVLDAMKAGVPVVISDRGSLREVAGDAAVYIDPEDVDSIAKGLSRLLNDEQLRSELWKKGHTQATKFSWERTVDIFLKAIR